VSRSSGRLNPIGAPGTDAGAGMIAHFTRAMEVLLR
jgi:hypothetical protein